MSIRVIHKKDQKIYDVFVSKMINGNRIQRRCRKSKSLCQAKIRERKLYAEIDKQFEVREQPTLKIWFENWIKKAKLSRKNSTIQSYELTLKKHVPKTVWQKPLAEITGSDISDIVHDPNLKIRSKTRQNILLCLRVIFRDALNDRLIAANPCNGINVKVPETKLQAWTLTEVNFFLNEAYRQNHPWYAHWVIAVFTGMRNGELYALKWRNVDLENQRIYITENWTYKDGFHGTKSGKNRVVPMGKELYTFLFEWKLKFKDSEWVLPRFNAWNKGQQAKVLRLFAKSIGLREINFHALRATFITICLLQGVPLVKVQAMVGHQSLETTMRYVRLIGSDLDGATDQIGIRLPTGKTAEIISITSG